MLGFWDAAASAGPYANNLHSLQTDNHSNTSSLNFYRPDALPDAQPKENESVPIQLAQCRFPGLAIFNGTLLWNFVHNSRNEKNFATPCRSYCQHNCSSLWITPTTIDASLLDARSLLHVGRLLPSYSVITLRGVVVRERGGTPFRQIFWSRNGALANIVGHRWKGR